MGTMNTELVRQAVEALRGQFSDVFVRLNAIGRFNPEAIRTVFTAIMDVVQAVETFSSTVSALTSEEKKSAAVTLINELIDIPFIPEFLEASLISWSIDLVVSVFNRIGGHGWLEALFGNK